MSDKYCYHVAYTSKSFDGYAVGQVFFAMDEEIVVENYSDSIKLMTEYIEKENKGNKNTVITNIVHIPYSEVKDA